MTDHTPDAEAAPPEQPAPLFNTLALDPKLLRAVAESGYMAMTPIHLLHHGKPI